MPRRLNPTIARGRWALPVAALFVGVGAIAAAPAWAQKVVPVTPPIATPVPTIPLPPLGGASPLTPARPDFIPAPALVSPLPVTPAGPVTAAPAAPAPLIRFRCTVPPGESACREPPPSDAGDSDADCDCARDFCYQDGGGNRVCEKAAD